MDTKLTIALFVKAPELGQVKSRLAKTIGADFATEFYRSMGRDWFDRLTAFADRQQADICVFYAPDLGRSTVRDWLGCDDRQLVAQGDGDLGDRMARAFTTCFEQGSDRVLLVGSDSPDLPDEILTQAAEALVETGAVICPTEDGGYCLVGFRRDRLLPTIFQNMVWSTETVFAETIARFQSANQPVAILPHWYDIDHATDLDRFWQLNQQNLDLKRSIATLEKIRQPIALSVIMPVLNEGERIQKTLDHLAEIAGQIPYEVIVVDGDRAGSTLQYLPSDRPVRGITAARGRGLQMNAGAAIARGEILLFLHADTQLPATAFQAIIQLFDPAPNPGSKGLKPLVPNDGARDQLVGGAFDLAIASSRWILRTIARIASVRSRLTRLPYGDQAIFIRRSAFGALGGYPEIPIMEDVALMRSIRRRGWRIRILPDRVLTSARRWEREGVWRCTLRNWTILLAYFAGVSPWTLLAWYSPERSKAS
ncbi:TIGR04283 family arsenosugar biosynthesis glycosyltransferase [Limnothrix sp. FACHB-1083]|uniref:TIGR04283 family arsenosugar biosynthesis glycosyltransferase n=1 Tax=unclassified Limnothrix TaxID=2632864 RepID=UPI0016804465|nr:MULTISPECIES: TIGR04283 family arsenosugar biosynthesis glycosyltransferase [unclassified Limnothrix]MBD2162690.1 TIGR04283 family arsenosugar biosynthesis glycosyltransferase [Limnothrix sp. FACHB-1083]MBD2193762.1 TIGR04283 family arsenosugar biosynthesis glycosyltransferase [Limnothrix sp. FACHB-1088]